MIITTFNRPKGTVQETSQVVREKLSVPPDILVVQECMRSDDDLLTYKWDGWMDRKGYGIAVRDGWSVRKGPTLLNTSARAFVVNTGEREINILNVWSHQDPSYVQGVLNVFEEVHDFLSQGTSIVLGDFNANPFFDNTSVQFSMISAHLNDRLGLISAYHHHHGQIHGNEPHPTYYHQWKEEQPFHIDYCFMALSMLAGSIVDIGSNGDWEGVSDHRPLSTRA